MSRQSARKKQHVKQDDFVTWSDIDLSDTDADAEFSPWELDVNDDDDIRLVNTHCIWLCIFDSLFFELFRKITMSVAQNINFKYFRPILRDGRKNINVNHIDARFYLLFKEILVCICFY